MIFPNTVIKLEIRVTRFPIGLGPNGETPIRDTQI